MRVPFPAASTATASINRANSWEEIYWRGLGLGLGQAAKQPSRLERNQCALGESEFDLMMDC